MEPVIIVTVLALAQFVFFGITVGRIRVKTGVTAPAISGDPEFERANRVHANTLEQLAVMLPALWIYAHYVNPLWGAGFGVVYLIGRFLYSSAYMKDPASRGIGFMMSFLPSVVMLVWVLVVAVWHYI